MTESVYTSDTFDIATEVAAKIMEAQKLGACKNGADLRYMLERQLDQYVRNGVLIVTKPADRR